MTQVVVIGAGPAGLAAAVRARGRGAEVVLVDAMAQVGGQYWRRPPEGPGGDGPLPGNDARRFAVLRERLAADPGCRVLTGTQVWALEQRPGLPPEVHLLQESPDGENRRLVLAPQALVLATGAHDRTLPFPGWDLPGVFTAGAAQTLAKGEGLPVGRRVLVAGAGPFLLPAAVSLAAAGARVVGVHEAASLGRLADGYLSRPWESAGALGKTLELGRYALAHARHRIPYRTASAVVAAHGAQRVESVTVAALDAEWAPVPGTGRELEVDAVCVSHGFTPRLELAVAAGCRIASGRAVLVDAAQRTSVPGVYAAGEITGTGGAHLALAEGAVAGHCAAGGDVADPGLRGIRRLRRVHAAFARRLEAAHAVRPGWRGWLDDATTVCRCEGVTVGTLREVAAATGSAGMRSLRLTTRAGLGMCQGRVCGRTVEELLGVEGAGDHRPVAVPVRLGDLASEPVAVELVDSTSAHRMKPVEPCGTQRANRGGA
ncbi:FAD-dependent oxidoreductase [Streptacidiphilus jiangxiensis]|uniref:Pyruvate/2-oxoglutarate dehydrogenase complex, dihydrolipoamide dehydrogenase (E3) component n=1 Tax=Streptacidiphilus jiangxiensis TaxID=235985 RepID=A0A1H7VNE1_STRJI|nr:FAD-dependent oxidoreductase [Streptacidiphilus jiangxiensis]SEM10761.1 Pyruvate/2-oxoglutarate dehydrogenase complex, dihydrolipoamide dehydrogenase (E3) component [Streptacidiphilus jiangxiensis]